MIGSALIYRLRPNMSCVRHAIITVSVRGLWEFVLRDNGLKATLHAKTAEDTRALKELLNMPENTQSAWRDPVCPEFCFPTFA